MRSTVDSGYSGRPPARLPFRWPQTFTSLRHRNYRFLWLSTLFMGAGQWIQQVTLGWLVFDLTGSYFLLGLVGSMRALPFILVGPLAGVAADRMDRRRLVMGINFFIGVWATLFASLVAFGDVQVWQIIVFTLVSGAAWSFSNPIRQALLPNVVPREDLMNAIALASSGFNLTRIIGPALGGVLIAAVGPGVNFYLQAALFFLAFAGVTRLRLPPVDPASRSITPWQSFSQGLGYVAKERTILLMIVIALVPSLFTIPFRELLPGFNERVLGQGPEGLGYLLASYGTGALVGTLAIASLGNFRKKGLLVVVATVAMGITVMLFSQTTALYTSVIVLTLVGAFQMVFHAMNTTIIQSIVPDAIRGRVMSIYMLDHGLVPLGALFAGGLAEFLGAPTAILIMGSLALLMALGIVVGFPRIRRLE